MRFRAKIILFRKTKAHVWAMRHSEKTVLTYRFTLQHSQKALKYGRIPSFFAVVARQIGYGQNCFAP
jgi:hypothetical protein